MEIKREKLDAVLKCVCVKPEHADYPVRALKESEKFNTYEALEINKIKIIEPDLLLKARENFQEYYDLYKNMEKGVAHIEDIKEHYEKAIKQLEENK